MRFAVTRLCGGQALMVASSEIFIADLEEAAQKLSVDGFTKKKNEDDLMMIFDWKGMEVTLYPQGKVMFYPLSEKNLAIEYATMIFDKVR